jgi:secreted protein with Ig-like and vWFA domain
MADDRNDRNRNAQAGTTGNDSENALRDELQREQKEAQGGIGDIAEDRNLTGSSSWLTDPPQPRKGGASNDDRSQR